MSNKLPTRASAMTRPTSVASRPSAAMSRPTASTRTPLMSRPVNNLASTSPSTPTWRNRKAVAGPNLGMQHDSGWSDLSGQYSSPWGVPSGSSQVNPGVSTPGYTDPWGQEQAAPWDQAVQNLAQQQPYTAFGDPQQLQQQPMELDEDMLDQIGEAALAEMGLADVEEDTALGLYEDEPEGPSYGMELARMDLFGADRPRRQHLRGMRRSSDPRYRYGMEQAESESARGYTPSDVVDVRPSDPDFMSSVKMGAGIAVGFATVGALLSLFGVIGRK